MKVDSVIAEYPKLSALIQRVADEPRIKEWIAKRPQTPAWKDNLRININSVYRVSI